MLCTHDRETKEHTMCTNVYPWGILFLANGRKSTMRWTKEGKHGKHGIGKVSKENTTFTIFVGQPSIHPTSSIHLCSVRRNTKVEIWLRVEVMVKTKLFTPLPSPAVPIHTHHTKSKPGRSRRVSSDSIQTNPTWNHLYLPHLFLPTPFPSINNPQTTRDDVFYHMNLTAVISLNL